MKLFSVIAAASIIASVVPAYAGNSLVNAGPTKGIAKSSMSATPDGEWNRLGRKDGKLVEVWTKDGDGLNKVMFIGGVPSAQPLFKEANKKERPLPKVSENMLLTDIPELLESSYRIQYDVRQMAVDLQEPAQVAGQQGLRFTYTFVRGDDEVERKGEALATFVRGKLYLVTYEAPAIYFFEKELGAFRTLASSLRM